MITSSENFSFLKETLQTILKDEFQMKLNKFQENILLKNIYLHKKVIINNDTNILNQKNNEILMSTLEEIQKNFKDKQLKDINSKDIEIKDNDAIQSTSLETKEIAPLVNICDLSPAIIKQKKIKSIIQYLESKKEIILDELNNLPEKMISEKNRSKHDWGKNSSESEIVKIHKNKIGWVYAWTLTNEEHKYWKNYGLIFNYLEIGENCNLCPKTMEILSNIPNIANCGFSLLEPHGVIEEHTDYLHDKNRSFHLGLKVPSTGSYLSLRENKNKIQTIMHEEGKAFAFNSMISHWALNFSNERRYILYLDIVIDT